MTPISPLRGQVVARQRPTWLKRSGAALTTAALAAAIVVAPGTITTAQAAEVSEREYFLDRGHVDAFYFNTAENYYPYAAGYTGPYLALKDDGVSPYEVRDPGNVEIHVKDAAQMEFPDNEYVLDPLRGESGYYLPLTQDYNLVWPGWESQPLAGSGYNNVDINITDVDGPGEIYLWTQGTFGGISPLLNPVNGEDNYSLPGTIHQSFLAHTHANWAFTAPGDYTFTVQGELSNSGGGVENFTTNSAEYLFSVGNFTRTPDTIAVEGDTEYSSGDDVSLTAVPEKAAVNVPRNDEGGWDVVEPTWQWESTTGDDEWTAVEGQISEDYNGEAAQDGEQLRAVATYADEARDLDIDVVSDPVELSVEQAETPISVAPLSHHYHQGSPIELSLVAEPELDAEDEVVWQWQLPGAEWANIPGGNGHTQELTAEQALDAVQVRAQVTLAATGEVVTTEPATIDVDDHGAPANQTVTISGAEDDYQIGDTAELEMTVDGTTILENRQWFTQHGNSDPVAIDGATDTSLSLELTEDHVGANVIAAVVHADGTIAYASEPTPLIAGDPGDDPSDEPTEEPTDEPDPTDEPGDPEQQVSIAELSHHYHSGEDIELVLEADPALADDDTVAWEWDLDGDWSAIPDAANARTHTLTAEPILNGVQVRAVVAFAATEESLTTDSVTIVIDDHDHGDDPDPTDEPTGTPTDEPIDDPTDDTSDTPSPDPSEETTDDDEDDRRAAEQNSAPGAGSGDGADDGAPAQTNAAGNDGGLADTGMDTRLLIAAGLALLATGTGVVLVLLKRRYGSR